MSQTRIVLRLASHVKGRSFIHSSTHLLHGDWYAWIVSLALVDQQVRGLTVASLSLENYMINEYICAFPPVTFARYSEGSLTSQLLTC